MRGETHQIDAERANVDRDFSNGLRCVAVQQHAARFADGRNLGQRLNDADLVVRKHDRDKARVVAKGICDLLRIEPARASVTVLLDIEQCDVVADSRQPRQRIENRLVLRRHADNVIAAPALALRHAADRQDCCFPSRRS